jgi:two-component system chemotaxis sensor kinase CheA
MVGELVIAQSIVRHDPDLEGLHSPRMQRNLAQLSRVTAEVQKTAMAMRMVEIGVLFQKMRRLVRDLAKKSGKRAELEVSGEDVEIDRTIVEELSDPMVHMLRNSMDHGIEMPEEREAAGKPSTGKITLRASHQGGQIVVEIADDGRGLNRERIVAKAVQRGLIESGERLTDAQVYGLIFAPGFSTAERVTEVSGRGVGMDVVQKQDSRHHRRTGGEGWAGTLHRSALGGAGDVPPCG